MHTVTSPNPEYTQIPSLSVKNKWEQGIVYDVYACDRLLEKKCQSNGQVCL